MALDASGFEILVANELLPDRAAVFSANFPRTKTLVGDIRGLESDIINSTTELLKGRNLDLLYATPPCQGMSKNGRGKLLQGIREGKKPKLDERNQLILSALNIARALKPRVILFENVLEMRDTLIIGHDGNPIKILDAVSQALPDYVGNAEVVEFADYGIPQRRQRLITVYTNIPELIEVFRKTKSFLPSPTHSEKGGLSHKKWVSVAEALKGTPPLCAGSKESASHPTIQFHRVPVLDKNKFFWVSNTPVGRGAFDNQCVNKDCLFQGNPIHGSKRSASGINQSVKTTPIKCEQCGELLPRPCVKDAATGEYRIMSGFTSAYKRMSPELPASALTSNLSYACSDHKIHPFENRVLSLHEAFIIHTIAKYEYQWERIDGKKVNDGLIRDLIGESIPPFGLQVITDHISTYIRCSSRKLGLASENSDDHNRAVNC